MPAPAETVNAPLCTSVRSSPSQVCCRTTFPRLPRSSVCHMTQLWRLNVGCSDGCHFGSLPLRSPKRSFILSSPYEWRISIRDDPHGHLGTRMLKIQPQSQKDQLRVHPTQNCYRGRNSLSSYLLGICNILCVAVARVTLTDNQPQKPDFLYYVTFPLRDSNSCVWLCSTK